MALFQLVSDYKPTGDQPAAIAELAEGLRAGDARQTLQGVTGSGKTFTIANVIAAQDKPALIISHNKTLAAQLFAELKAFFPNNAVEYFISYYDYYQPEAYIPQTDTFIEKDSSVNDAIERFRLAATNSLLYRRDVIIVASVSCIYGLGSPEDYAEMVVRLERDAQFPRDELLELLVEIQYQRNDVAPSSGEFRVRGDIVDIYPSYREDAVRVEFFDDQIVSIRRYDPLLSKCGESLERFVISPARHFVMPEQKIKSALSRIESELSERLADFQAEGKLLEAERLTQRTNFDLQMLRELGYCSGIENYSRHLAGRASGEPPACLLDYFPADGFLTIIDESHVTLPQLHAMSNGDGARKQTLIRYGFRLPSAADNRPLRFDEFNAKIGQAIFMSATPGVYEREVSAHLVKQVIRPTGLLDPPVEVRPLEGQIDDVMEEIRRTAADEGGRTLVTTLTKRTAEDLAAYLTEAGLRVEYLHSGIDALERIEILRRLRAGAFDCLVGINLLREGLDLPEVALVAVLDADKEGFLRSETSLTQTAGRAARHVNGRVLLYADVITDSMRRMIDETNARREKQIEYNKIHNITPRSVKRAISEEAIDTRRGESSRAGGGGDVQNAADILNRDDTALLAELTNEMLQAAEALEFERAAELRDEINALRGKSAPPSAPGKKRRRGTPMRRKL